VQINLFANICTSSFETEVHVKESLIMLLWSLRQETRTAGPCASICQAPHWALTLPHHPALEHLYAPQYRPATSQTNTTPIPQAIDSNNTHRGLEVSPVGHNEASRIIRKRLVMVRCSIPPLQTAATNTCAASSCPVSPLSFFPSSARCSVYACTSSFPHRHSAPSDKATALDRREEKLDADV
jgi:hypothetical protein